MLHSWYFPQFAPAFIDLKPEQRMEIYTEVMALGLWDEKSELAKRVSDAYKQYVQEKELEVVRWETQVLTLKKTDYRTQKLTWDKQRLARKRARGNQLKAARADLVGARLVVQDFNTKILAYNKKVEEFNAKVKKLNTDLDYLREKVRKVNSNATRLDSQRGRLVTEIATVRKGKCPTCGQKLHTQALSIDLSARLKEVEENLKRELEEAESLNERIYTKEEELKNLPLPADDKLESKLEVANLEMEHIEDEVKELTAPSEEEVNPFLELIQTQKDEIAHATAMLEIRKEERKESEEMQSRSAFWIKGFKEIRYQVMEDSLRQLNTEVNECLQQLGLADWEITFSAEKETKSGTIKRGFLCSVRSPHTSVTVPWEAWSGGESQRLRLAAQFGISNLLAARSGFTPSVEFWDEPTQYLSEGGVTQLLEQLEERANRYGRIILLADHRALDYPFKGTVHIAKTSEGSTIDTRYQNAP